jgi:hypothetical protein
MSNVTSTSSPHTIERLSPSVSREWLLGKTIVVYKVTDAHRESIDTWAEACAVDITNWPGDRPVLIIHDLSARGIALTPYARERSQPLMDMRPEAKGRIALVLPGNIAASLIQLFVRSPKKAPRARHAFSSREKALEWLLSE